MTSSAERARAAQLLASIANNPNRTIDWVSANRSPTPLESELIYGVCRRYYSLSETVDPLLSKPLRAKDSDVYHLLLVGAYQLQYLKIPTHAVVSESVNAARDLRKPWARGLVNAVLRKIQREPVGNPERTFDCPPWIEHLVTAQYADGADILRALLERAPQAIRVNEPVISVSRYQHALAAAGIAAEQPWRDETFILGEPQRQQSLPGFQKGQFAVQDAAAQFAAKLFEVPETGRWLDACAAPGGKLLHIMARFPQAQATAVEINAKRAETIEQSASRLRSGAFDLHVADATTQTWWDGKPFDAMLMDAPCTGIGTLRRNPDIKLHRSEEDLQTLTQLQTRMLDNLWQMLNTGSSLLYCTCSILRQENDDIIEHFLATHPDAAAEPVNLPTGRATPFGWQLLPTDPHTDGLYYSRLRKAA